MEGTISNERFQTFANLREHLSKVYMVLGRTAAATAVGALWQMRGFIDLGDRGAEVAVLVIFLTLYLCKDNGNNYYMRLNLLYALGFCFGQILGPLLGYICSVNPAIILTALTGTFAIFVTLSLAALLAEQGKYLYLKGMLGGVSRTMSRLRLFNWMFKSFFVQVTTFCIDIFLFAAIIVHRTQEIEVKCRNGNRDVVQHAQGLFIVVASMFYNLLIILMAALIVYDTQNMKFYNGVEMEYVLQLISDVLTIIERLLIIIFNPGHFLVRI